MPKKVLFCATIDNHFKSFHMPYLKWFKEQGWEVHVAASGDMELPYVDKKFNIPFQRSPFTHKNFKVYTELKSIIDDHKYNIIHCHTPMGGVLARLAGRQARKQGTQVLYTAHGFHFCKGAPLINWMIYYPIEKWLARYTDCLITINEEDYKLAINHGFKAKRIEHVHGVGVNIERYEPIGDKRKLELRENLGYKADDFLMFYAAEFNKNKNQQLLIRALTFAKDDVPNAKLLLAGEGHLLEACRSLSEQLGVTEMVDFLGYRNDIDSILPVCDVAIGSSLREGLPVNIMEAMACGLPIVATNNRGHNELIHSNVNGWIVAHNNEREMADKLKILFENRNLKRKFGKASRRIIKNKYAINEVLEVKRRLYSSYMGEMERVKWATQ